MELHLYEKFVLIALDYNKGKFVIDALALNYGIAGAILLELSEMDKIKINNKKVCIADLKYTKNVILDDCIKLIHNAKKTRKVRFWITKIGNKSSHFKKIILNDLVHKNVLRIEQKSVFFRLIKFNRFPVINKNLIDDLKNRIRKIVLNNEKADTESIILLSLVNSGRLIRVLFPSRNEYRTVKKRIKELVQDIEISEAVSQTLKEIQAAIAATTATYVGAG